MTEYVASVVKNRTTVMRQGYQCDGTMGIMTGHCSIVKEELGHGV